MILQYNKRPVFKLSREVEQFAYKNRPAKNIYRIEQKDLKYDNIDIGVGIYTYFNNIEKDAEHTLRKILISREPRPHLNINIKWKGTLPCLRKMKRPGIFEDPELRYSFKYFLHIGDESVCKKLLYGFSSLQQLNNWFYTKDEIEMMHEEGFVLSVYRCKKYMLGLNQAVFLTDQCSKVEEISLLTI